MSAAAFIAWMKRQDGKFELVNGEVRARSLKARLEAEVRMNILQALRTKLRGSGYRACGLTIAVEIDAANASYPAAMILHDPRDLRRDPLVAAAMTYPCAIFEVLPPSRPDDARGGHFARYREIESVKVIVLVDPMGQTCETYERLDADSWRVRRHPAGAALELAEPRVTLTAEEMFAED